MTMEGQGEHRWIGFIVFKDQSTITNRFIKCKKTDSVGTIVSQCPEFESAQLEVVVTYGGQNCLQVPQNLTSIFQLMVLDNDMPVEVIYDMNFRYVYVYVRDTRVQGQDSSADRKSAFDILMGVNRNYTHLPPLKRYVSCRAVFIFKKQNSYLQIL